MYTTRELPFAEWYRLDTTELAHLATLKTDPGPDIAVLVVENMAGDIVACWSRIVSVHVEGLYNVGGAKAGALILGAMVQHLQQFGVKEVLTTAMTEEVEKLLERIGGNPVPGRMWVVPLPQVEALVTAGGH